MKSIQANNIQIAYQDLGSGPPLLLITGSPLDHSTWSAQAEGLQKSYRLIIPDLRGLGETEDPGEPFSIKTMADDAVAGFSMGGFILAHMFVHHPAKVRAAGFVSTSGTSAATPEHQAHYKTMARLAIDEGLEALADAHIQKIFAPAFTQSHPREVAQTRSVIGGQRPESVALMLDAVRLRPDMAAHIKDFSVPSLIIVGDEDTIVPVAAMQAFDDAMPDSVLEIIEGVGHMTPVEAPEKVSSLLDQLMQRAGVLRIPS